MRTKISSPVFWRPAWCSCPWCSCWRGSRSVTYRRHTPPPPQRLRQRPPWRPAAFAWRAVAFDSSAELLLSLEDFGPHTTSRSRCQSFSVQRSLRGTRPAGRADFSSGCPGTLKVDCRARLGRERLAAARIDGRRKPQHVGYRRRSMQAPGNPLLARSPRFPAQRAGWLGTNFSGIKADATARWNGTRTALVAALRFRDARVARASPRAARLWLGQPRPMTART